MLLREERDPLSSFINALKAPETRRQYPRRIAQLPNAVLAWDVGPILTPPGYWWKQQWFQYQMSLLLHRLYDFLESKL